MRRGRIDRSSAACYLFVILMRSGSIYGLGVASLVSLLAWGLGANSFSAQGSSVVEPGNYHLATGFSSIVGADFDGDMKPDMIVGTAAGRGYVLQIQFSTQIPSASLALDSALPGMTVLSRDINQDNDADLIVTSCTSLIPVAVFLGDGKGHFQPDNPWNYVPVGLNSSRGYGSPSGNDGPAGNTTEDRRFSEIAWCRDLPDIELDRQRAPLSVNRNPAARTAGFILPLRGPPAASNL